ncbi:hypothetical protein SLS55_003441 [Diplodia seriata]|uniref:Uncharacterized protein n=1 Tax=Diplodia seriata TaxID=420778 RepID=A0ABR3CP11_9PEZI
MEPSQQLDDLDTRLRTCSINSPTVPPPSTPSPASGHVLHSRVVSAPAALTSQTTAQPDDDGIGDISKILTQLFVLQHVEFSEALYGELLRQAWATYRGRGLPPAQFRTLVDAECGPQRKNLAAMRRELEETDWTRLTINKKAEMEDMELEYEERSTVLRQREEMLLSVLPEGERDGPKWEPTPAQFGRDMPTEEDLALLVRDMEERAEERRRKRAGCEIFQHTPKICESASLYLTCTTTKPQQAARMSSNQQHTEATEPDEDKEMESAGPPAEASTATDEDTAMNESSGEEAEASSDPRAPDGPIARKYPELYAEQMALLEAKHRFVEYSDNLKAGITLGRRELLNLYRVRWMTAHFASRLGRAGVYNTAELDAFTYDPLVDADMQRVMDGVRGMRRKLQILAIRRAALAVWENELEAKFRDAQAREEARIAALNE